MQRSSALLLLQVQGKSVWRTYALANPYEVGSWHSASVSKLSTIELGVNYRKRIFDEMHRSKTATLNAIRERFWWPNWTVDVTSMLKACEKCQISKN